MSPGPEEVAITGGTPQSGEWILRPGKTASNRDAGGGCKTPLEEFAFSGAGTPCSSPTSALEGPCSRRLQNEETSSW